MAPIRVCLVVHSVNVKQTGSAIYLYCSLIKKGAEWESLICKSEQNNYEELSEDKE
jgi:hypothetical protein